MLIKNFIVFEGIDGAGTSTQIELLKKRTESSFMSFSSEPTTAQTGVFLRKILKGEISVSPQTITYLFAADRAEHIYGKNGVQELTEKGFVVVSDRYFFSSLAYQSVTCGNELPRLVNSAFPLPEILFFFDIEPKTSLSRIQNREQIEIYENEKYLCDTATMYKTVINEYKQKSPEMKIINLDATKSKEEIAQIIWSNLKNLPIFKK